MLDINPDSRPSAKQCIEHEWFLENFTTLQNMLEVSRLNSPARKIALEHGIEDGNVSFIDAPCLFLKNMDVPI